MPNYLTEEGLKKLQVELIELKTVKRPTVIRRIAEARELGDLSENGDYQDAKDEQAFIEGKILELENTINKSEIISRKQSSIIEVGSTVKADCAGSEREFTIVGSNEANPANGFISHQSPMGMAFLGKKEGDMVMVEVPSGTLECKVLKIIQ